LDGCKKRESSSTLSRWKGIFITVLILLFIFFQLPLKPVLKETFNSPLRAENLSPNERTSETLKEKPQITPDSASKKETEKDSNNFSNSKIDTGVEKTEGEEPLNQEPRVPYEYQEPDLAPQKVSYTALVLRTIAILAVIIIGIYILFRVLVKNKGKLIADTDMIRVLGTYPLASNRLIQVVEIADKILILGVTDSNINLIMSVDDKEHADRIKLMSSKESRGGKTFKEQLLNLIGGKAFSRSGQISYLNNYKERINRMKKL